MTDPRAYWCPCCGWKLPGLLTIPFVQKCLNCRRTITVDIKDGVPTLRVKGEGSRHGGVGLGLAGRGEARKIHNARR